MNSSLQHSYVSNLFTFNGDAQDSKATQTRLQDRKIIIQTQNKIVFT